MLKFHEVILAFTFSRETQTLDEQRFQELSTAFPDEMRSKGFRGVWILLTAASPGDFSHLTVIFLPHIERGFYFSVVDLQLEACPDATLDEGIGEQGC